MPVLSHLHQLFNAEQCQAYIHILRWKDRPLQCPRCLSLHIGRWGTYQYALEANVTGVTAASAPSTILPVPCSTRASGHWRTGFSRRLLCLACSSRRIAREVGVHIRTSYRWCWWLRNAALSYELSLIHISEPTRLLSI